MTGQTAEPLVSRPRRRRAALLLGSLIAALVGISGLTVLLREGRAPADLLNAASPLRGSAGFLVLGIIGLIGTMFWDVIEKRPALSGGLLAGGLMSLALTTKVGWIYLLLVPLGGFASVAHHLRQRGGISARAGAAIGGRSGLIGAATALAFAVPAALFVNDRVNTAYRSFAQAELPSVFGGRTPPDLTTPESTMVGWLIVSTVGVGLAALGGSLRAKMYRRAAK